MTEECSEFAACQEPTMTGMIVTAGLSAWGILVLFACALWRVAGDADRRMTLETVADRQQTSGVVRAGSYPVAGVRSRPLKPISLHRSHAPSSVQGLNYMDRSGKQSYDDETHR
jgi:hypothetical protein